MSGIVLTRTTDDFRESVTAAFDGSPIDVREVQLWGGFDPLAIDELVADRPDVVAVGPDVDHDDALKLVEELDLRHPEVSVVLVAQPTADLWPLALRAGVRDVVAPYTTGAQLRDAFTRASDASQRLRGASTNGHEPETGGRVISVISPKGGCGKTTIATNLAATLARHRPDEVVIADLDLQFGDVNHALRLDPEYTMLHASAEGVTPTVLKGFLTSHPGKLHALCAPEHPEDADDITAERAIATVGELAQAFPFVVVDTAAGLDDHTLAAAELATDVVFVSATDVPSVRAMVKELDILNRLGVLGSKPTHLVLNRADARVGLDEKDIAQTIGMDIALSIPSSRAIPAALNQGEPIVLVDDRSTISRNFEQFVGRLGVATPDERPLWPWRKSR